MTAASLSASGRARRAVSVEETLKTAMPSELMQVPSLYIGKTR